MKEIPLLTANDVELRVQSITKNDSGCVLLVYKDARVDMRVLDSVFGWNNWQREHVVIDGQLFCTVKIWDEEKGQWICKQDVGTESNTQAEKGRASDSFKRACFNIGIGRELYAAPFLYIPLNQSEVMETNGRKQLNYKVKFTVKTMTFDKELGEFTEFIIVDQTGKERFTLKKKKKEEKPKMPETPVEEKTDGLPPSLEDALEMFGGTVEPPKVIVKEGVTLIFVKGAYHSLAGCSIEQLNWVTYQKEYAACHDEARKLLMEKTK